jgi:hypothetical protein
VTKPERHKAYIPVSPVDPKNDVTHLCLSTYYAKGGMSYFSGQSSPSAIWVSVIPVCRKGDGVESFLLGKGKKIMLESATRLNRNRVAAQSDFVASAVSSRSGELYEKFLRVAAEEGLVIKSTEPIVEMIKDIEAEKSVLQEAS